MDVDASGSYTLGLRVPMPPMFRALNAIVAMTPHKLLQWMIPLDFESVQRRAKLMTNIDSEDYGEFLDMESFRTMLGNTDVRSSFIGRLFLWMKAPTVLGFHLRVAQILRDHPEVLNQTIVQPIFIAGYVRSGSTWLQHIMVETYGASLRYVPFRESLGGGIELDPQRPGSLKKLAEFTMSNMKYFPSMFSIHEVDDVDQPEEEIGWTDMTCRGFLTAIMNDQPGLDTLVVQPSSARMRYKLLKVLMQIKQREEGPQRWLLKSPEHLTGVHELAEAFPDAKVVTIDRDAVSIYKSLLFLFHTSRSMINSYVDPSVTKIAADIQLCSQRRGLQTIPSIDIESLQLHFREVIEQPIGTLKRLALFAGFEWNTTIEARAEVAVQAASLKKTRMGGKIVYQLGAFGLTEAGVQERLDNCGSYGSFENFKNSSTLKSPRMAVEGAIFVDRSSNATEVAKGLTTLTNITDLTNFSNFTSVISGTTIRNAEFKFLAGCTV
jgi:hypothetical protein